MRRTILLGFSVAFFGCGSSSGEEAHTPPPSTATAAASMSAATSTSVSTSTATAATDAPEAYAPPTDLPAPSPAPAPLAVSVRNAGAVRLAKAAAACKFDEGSIDRDCNAFTAWMEEEKAFEKNGNVTLLSLLEDADPKIRQVAAARAFDKADEFFADKDNARRLIAIAAKETDAEVANLLGNRVTNIDAEKVGLKGEFFALTQHPQKKFREALSFYLLGHNPSAFNLIVAERLMNDSDARVQEEAVGSLSTGGITKGTDGVCKLLAKELKRTDKPGAEAHWAAGTSNCGSVFPALIDSLEKRVGENGKMFVDNFDRYALAASSACSPRPKFDDATLATMKKRLFAVGKLITAPTQKDPNMRNFGIRVLTDCDPVAARPVLEAMAKETGKDSFVADRAKDALKDLK
jgi:hypothetical protein